MKSIIGIITFYIAKIISKFIRINPNYIILGAWEGERYLDNTKYLYEYLLNNTNEYKLIWIGNKRLESCVSKNDKTIFCEKNSIKSIYYIFKSKFIIVTHSLKDISYLPIFIGKIKILTDHGIPIKKWSMDDQRIKLDQNLKLSRLRKMYIEVLGDVRKYNYFVSASKLNDSCIVSAEYHLGATYENIIRSGTPRNDYLINITDTEIEKLKKKYSDLLGFDINKKVILYAPTFRRTSSNIETFYYYKNRELLQKFLKDNNYVLIEKNHFATIKQNDIISNNFIDTNLIKIDESLDNKINIQEILCFTDILISDYSGVFLDFTIMNRPIINFIFDYDYYKDIDSGLYYEKEQFCAGKIAYTIEEVLDEISKIANGQDCFEEVRLNIRKKFLEYEKGDACQKILNLIQDISKNQNQIIREKFDI